MATRIEKTASAVRKRPCQARSRATTDAILDAAAHILGEYGWEGLTTNRVAEIAGVSIGSLYQYFPNKIALIEDVRRRHLDEVLSILRSAAEVKSARAQRIAALVDGMIAVHSRYPAAHRVLLEESPRGKETRSFHDRFEQECRKCYEAIFKINATHDANTDLGAQILASALSSAVHDAARTDMLASPMMRKELLRLLDRYL